LEVGKLLIDVGIEGFNARVDVALGHVNFVIPPETFHVESILALSKVSPHPFNSLAKPPRLVVWPVNGLPEIKSSVVGKLLLGEISQHGNDSSGSPCRDDQDARVA
jgi:hypothetical protein